MIHEKYFKVLHSPRVSEKTSLLIEKNNTIVLKVLKDSTKSEIKSAIQNLLETEVKYVNTLIVKGKVKCHGKYVGRLNNWKKAYITLKEGSKVDLFKRIG